jgi:hypothetical protein
MRLAAVGGVSLVLRYLVQKAASGPVNRRLAQKIRLCIF